MNSILRYIEGPSTRLSSHRAYILVGNADKYIIKFQVISAIGRFEALERDVEIAWSFSEE